MLAVLSQVLSARMVSTLLFKDVPGLTISSDMLNVMLAERDDAYATQAEYEWERCADDLDCEIGYDYLHHCWCLPYGWGFKRDTGITPREEAVGPIPFDPRVFCRNHRKCGDGSASLWSQHTGRCYCPGEPHKLAVREGLAEGEE